MKRPNYKLYVRLAFIELIGIILLCVASIVGLLLVLDTTYPFFKYTSLFSYILCLIFILIAFIRLGFIAKKFKLEKFQQASKTTKLRYSFAFLFYSLLIITPIEYILYLKNIDSVTIDKEILEYSIQDDLDNINNHIGINERYESIYDNILQNICDSTSYLCYYEDEKYFLVINSDTIQIRLHKRAGMAPPMHIRERGKEHDFYGVRECGISLKNESYNLTHPASRDLKTDILSCDSISGKNIKRLIEQKIQYYKNSKDRFCQILEKDSHISFGDFLVICLLDQGVIDSKANIVIKLLLVIQAIIITFISGYIYQIVYKILDGE
jgi:hypothetical protein